MLLTSIDDAEMKTLPRSKIVEMLQVLDACPCASTTSNLQEVIQRSLLSETGYWEVALELENMVLFLADRALGKNKEATDHPLRECSYHHEHTYGIAQTTYKHVYREMTLYLKSLGERGTRLDPSWKKGFQYPYVENLKNLEEKVEFYFRFQTGEATFGDVRSLLHNIEHSRTNFNYLARMLEPMEGQDEFETLMKPYIISHLKNWEGRFKVLRRKTHQDSPLWNVTPIYQVLSDEQNREVRRGEVYQPHVELVMMDNNYLFFDEVLPQLEHCFPNLKWLHIPLDTANLKSRKNQSLLKPYKIYGTLYYTSLEYLLKKDMDLKGAEALSVEKTIKKYLESIT